MAKKGSGVHSGAIGLHAAEIAAAADPEEEAPRQESLAQELAKKQVRKSIKALIDIRDDAKQTGATRAAAARTLLEYAEGKPGQAKDRSPRIQVAIVTLSEDKAAEVRQIEATRAET